MNSWFILYRLAKVALNFARKLDCDEQSKINLQFAVPPLLPSIYIFNLFFIRNMYHIEWNRMQLEF